MKRRSGLVSNSSSSSFIIGLAKLKNVDAFKNWSEENEIKLTEEPDKWIDGYFLLTTDQINESDSESLIVREDILEIEAPVNSCRTIFTPYDASKENTYLIVCVGNDEGDNCFYDGYDGLDYDIVDDDWFSGSQANIIKVLKDKDNGFFSSQCYMIGADRNG